MLTYVLAADGSPLMPTYNIRKVRRMLKDGRAVMTGHKPGFTIRLTYALPDQKTPHTQKVELCEDTGYQHIGISAKSAKHEFVHLQVDTLADEKGHHDAQRRYRRARRGRLRYRAPRFDNRTYSKKPGWLAPSLQHKADIHVRLVSTFQRVLPIRDVYLEVGTFDTQALEAKEKGLPIPEGSDYQHGIRYGIATLREAVFYRDGYKCQCCGKGIKDGRILRVHLDFSRDRLASDGDSAASAVPRVWPLSPKLGGRTQNHALQQTRDFTSYPVGRRLFEPGGS